ncbi:MAG: hypothetical protein U0520_04360 [Candidatus Saccharimonadales bacterium]
MNNTQGTTKQDLQELEQRMNAAMEGFMQKILNALSPEIQEIKSDFSELKVSSVRIENKLDATVNKVADHGIRTQHPETQAA